jgi:hypothetical protein
MGDVSRPQVIAGNQARHCPLTTTAAVWFLNVLLPIAAGSTKHCSSGWRSTRLGETRALRPSAPCRSG